MMALGAASNALATLWYASLLSSPSLIGAERSLTFVLCVDWGVGAFVCTITCLRISWRACKAMSGRARLDLYVHDVGWAFSFFSLTVAVELIALNAATPGQVGWQKQLGASINIAVTAFNAWMSCFAGVRVWIQARLATRGGNVVCADGIATLFEGVSEEKVVDLADSTFRAMPSVT